MSDEECSACRVVWYCWMILVYIAPLISAPRVSTSPPSLSLPLLPATGLLMLGVPLPASGMDVGFSCSLSPGSGLTLAVPGASQGLRNGFHVLQEAKKPKTGAWEGATDPEITTTRG